MKPPLHLIDPPLHLITHANQCHSSLVVRAEDAVLAMNVIHSKVLHIPTHWEQETNFIKGAETQQKQQQRARRAENVVVGSCYRPPPLTHPSSRSMALLTRTNAAAAAVATAGLDSRRSSVDRVAIGPAEAAAYRYIVKRWLKRRRHV